MQDNPEFVGMAEACAMLCISSRTLERKLRDPDNGFPRPFTIRRKRYFRREDLRCWVDAQAIGAPVYQPRPYGRSARPQPQNAIESGWLSSGLVLVA